MLKLEKLIEVHKNWKAIYIHHLKTSKSYKANKSLTENLQHIQTLVLVSQRTSNCSNLSDRWPASWLPRNQGRQWHPGSRTSSNLPNFSLMATVDWSTCTQQKRLPIWFLLWESNSLYISLKELKTNINLITWILRS